MPTRKRCKALIQQEYSRPPHKHLVVLRIAINYYPRKVFLIIHGCVHHLKGCKQLPYFLLVFCAAGVAVFSFVGFERLFYGVHHLLFDNDFWILDPKTDILIRMMPQTLFEETFLRVLKKTLIQSGLITAVFAAVFVYMRKRVRQWTGK